MKTLTQVWLVSAASCFIILVIGFQMGGRIGLFVAFLISLLFLYLIFYKGLLIFIKKTKAHEVTGNDLHYFAPLLKDLAHHYSFKKIRLFISQSHTPPLVWPELHDQLIVFINGETLSQLNNSEKKIFAHLVLSHGQIQSKLARRFLGLLFISTYPIEKIFAPFFNLIGYLLGLNKEIYTADLKALTLSQTSHFEFGLFLHKLHFLNYHTQNIFEGTYFFQFFQKQIQNFTI